MARAGTLLSLVLSAAMVVQLLQIWIAPQRSQADELQLLLVLIAFEFIMVHSGVFMSVFPRKMSLFLFVPFYGLFALSFNASVPGNALLWVYLGVVFVRMRFAFSDPSDAAKQKAISFALGAVFAYFPCILPFAILADRIPKLGLNDDYLAESGFAAMDTMGVFFESPAAGIAFGVWYFSALVWLEYRLYVKRPASPTDMSVG